MHSAPVPDCCSPCIPELQSFLTCIPCTPLLVKKAPSILFGDVSRTGFLISEYIIHYSNYYIRKLAITQFLFSRQSKIFHQYARFFLWEHFIASALSASAMV